MPRSRTSSCPRSVRRGLRAAALSCALLAAGGAGTAAGTPVAWEVRILSADFTTTDAPREELLLDIGGDPLERRLGLRQGTFLSHVTGLPVGRTRDEGGTTLVAELEEPFTVESESGGFELDVEARAGSETHGRLVAELVLRLGPRLERRRSVPLSPHRARLWVVPGWSRVHAVLIEAWRSGSPPQVPRPSETARVELALVRGAWRAGAGPESLPQSDFPTWVDPFALEPGESAEALLRPVSAGVADSGTLVFRQALDLPLGELMTLERGTRPTGGGSGHADYFGATLLVREAAEDRAGLPGESPGQWIVNLSLQTSHLGAPSLVQMRRLAVQPGAVHAWLVPTDENVHVLFVRVTPGRPGAASPVHPGPAPR